MSLRQFWKTYWTDLVSIGISVPWWRWLVDWPLTMMPLPDELKEEGLAYSILTIPAVLLVLHFLFWWWKRRSLPHSKIQKCLVVSGVLFACGLVVTAMFFNRVEEIAFDAQQKMGERAFDFWYKFVEPLTFAVGAACLAGFIWCLLSYILNRGREEPPPLPPPLEKSPPLPRT